MTLVAKNNFITKFVQGGNLNGVTYSITKNGTAISANTDYQIFTEDTIVITVNRPDNTSAYYNFQPTFTYKVLIGFNNSAGTTGKEVVINAR